MNSLLKKKPNIQFFGIGGRKMEKVGLKSIVSLDKMAVMGFFEVIKHLNFFRKLINTLLKEISICKPVQIILIDYPGFNLRLAMEVKKQFNVPKKILC